MYEQRIEKYEYKQMFFNLLFGIIAISNIAVAYIYIKNDTIELICDIVVTAVCIILLVIVNKIYQKKIDTYIKEHADDISLDCSEL